MNELLENFHYNVALKYSLYNSLFLTLPFQKMQEVGTLLNLFGKYCAKEIQHEKHPKEIISRFFKQNLGTEQPEEYTKLLFVMLQFVERQIVLFDALEDAAYDTTHQLQGPGAIHYLINKIVNSNRQADFSREIKNYRVKIVLTAHPTQFYPVPVLGIITQLTTAIKNNDLKEISNLLWQMGKTSFKHQQKPTPFEEAQSLVWYIENIFYKVIPKLHQQINAALHQFNLGANNLDTNHCAMGVRKGENRDSSPSFRAIGFADAQDMNQEANPAVLQRDSLNHPCVELGFWPGGDRDGNPNVNAGTTLAVAKLLKSQILKLYAQDLRQLSKRLTFKGVLSNLNNIRRKVDGSENPYLNAEDLLADLHLLRNILISEHESLFLDHLDEMITKVRCFGFHLAAMDMRENAPVHRNVFKELLLEIVKKKWSLPISNNELKNYYQLDDEKKYKVLRILLQAEERFTLSETAEDCQFTRTIQSIAAISPIQVENGEKGLCRYVISNTQSQFDILEALTLLHLTGHFNNSIPVDIIPLFESIEDLENSTSIMESVFHFPEYQQHLARRGGVQTIMLGFSDGTKDGGYVAANWSIYKAKTNLTQIAVKNKIKVIFFDGRGGPPARGGGNTHQFYRSLGSQISHQVLQLTIQGQTISSNFGTELSASYNIEQLFTAGIDDLIFPESANDLSPENKVLLQKLADESRVIYTSLKEDPLFVPYLEEMTPLKFYGELNIGSRPTSRKKTATLQFSDLRAIPFVGSWNQLKQNIPGYFGFGSALKNLINLGLEPQLKQLYHESLFFRTLVENTMMSLCKTFFPLTAYMRKDQKFGKFWRCLNSEAELTATLLQQISGQKYLLEKDPVVRESIRMREEIVLPLLVIQQFAMTQLKDTDQISESTAAAFKEMILKALAANTNASRNSA